MRNRNHYKAHVLFSVDEISHGRGGAPKIGETKRKLVQPPVLTISTWGIILLRAEDITNAEDWPLWLQIVVGVPNAVGLVWARIWIPKTQI